MRSAFPGPLLLGVFLLLSAASVSAYEEPAYEVIQSFGDVELRRYAAYVVAETSVEGDFNRARGQAFRRLFNFISGDNTRREEIDVNAPDNPTVRRSKGEKIAMTVPVFSNSIGDQQAPSAWTMEFVMPPGLPLEAIPVPRDARVRLRTVPAHVVAAYRYSGGTGERRFQEHAQRLLRQLSERQIEVLGDPVQAVYNGPFTIGPLRRNEALVPVRLPSAVAQASPSTR